MRCLVLADALRERGDSVRFACRPQQGDLIELIRNKGFDVIELVAPKVWQQPKSSSDYAAWLQVPWQEDAESVIEQIEQIDLLIVDHYGLNREWEETVKRHYSCKLVAIDDLVRQHRAEIIIDQTLLRDADDYRAINPDSVILAGCDFALLNPLFADYRQQLRQQGKNLSQSVKILVTMGGVDKPNATMKVLQALSEFTDHSQLQVTVLLNPKAPHYSQVSEFSEQNKEWIRHFDFIDNMAELMSHHCIAIGAPGTTSWERACLGIPSIIIPLAPNQADIANSLEVAKAAVKVELSVFDRSFKTAVADILKNWQEYHETNLSVCDGLGRERVLQEIQGLF